MSKIKRIGITGGIGSGKSTVCSLLRDFGYTVWDADVFSAQVLHLSHVTENIKSQFGADSYIEPGKLNREYIRNIVFSDPDKRKILESIIHPEIKNLFDSRIESLGQLGFTGWIFYEAAIIIETGRYQEFDYNVLVTCNEESRVTRLLNSRKLNFNEIKKIIGSQMPDYEKIKHVQAIISNNDTHEKLESEVYLLIKKIKESFETNI